MPPAAVELRGRRSMGRAGMRWGRKGRGKLVRGMKVKEAVVGREAGLVRVGGVWKGGRRGRAGRGICAGLGGTGV